MDGDSYNEEGRTLVPSGIGKQLQIEPGRVLVVDLQVVDGADRAEAVVRADRNALAARRRPRAFLLCALTEMLLLPGVDHLYVAAAVPWPPIGSGDHVKVIGGVAVSGLMVAVKV